MRTTKLYSQKEIAVFWASLTLAAISQIALIGWIAADAVQPKYQYATGLGTVGYFIISMVLGEVAWVFLAFCIAVLAGTIWGEMRKD